MKLPKYEIIISKAALKELKKLPHPLRQKLWNKASVILSSYPFPRSGNPKKLKGEEVFRLRIGDYRIVYTIEGKWVQIFIFGHRKEVYRKL